MLLEDAVEVLTGWDAPDGQQKELQQHYLRHLEAHPDGMWRACRPEHVTASALVVDGAGERVLLTLHRTIGLWLQLGGHCEREDQTLAGAALREATEESGLSGLTIEPTPVRLSRHEILAGGCAGTYHLDVQFLVTAAAGTAYVVSEESHDLAWFGVDELPSGLDESVRQLVASGMR